MTPPDVDLTEESFRSSQCRRLLAYLRYLESRIEQLELDSTAGYRDTPWPEPGDR